MVSFFFFFQISRFNVCIKLAVVLQENMVLTYLEMEKLYEKIKLLNMDELSSTLV